MKDLGLPELIAQEQTEKQRVLTLFVTPSLACLKGHFPQLPIVAGLAQLHWVVHYGHDLLGLPKQVLGVEALKFKSVLQAEQTVELLLHYDASKGKLHFLYKNDTAEFSSGRVILRKHDV